MRAIRFSPDKGTGACVSDCWCVFVCSLMYLLFILDVESKTDKIWEPQLSTFTSSVQRTPVSSSRLINGRSVSFNPQPMRPSWRWCRRSARTLRCGDLFSRSISHATWSNNVMITWICVFQNVTSSPQYSTFLEHIIPRFLTFLQDGEVQFLQEKPTQVWTNPNKKYFIRPFLRNSPLKCLKKQELTRIFIFFYL